MIDLIDPADLMQRVRAPKVYGEIEVQNIKLSQLEKSNIEQAISDWIYFHSKAFHSDDIQYQVAFERISSGNRVSCYLEISDTSGSWESLEVALEPFKAFRRCLSTLSPAVSNTA